MRYAKHLMHVEFERHGVATEIAIRAGVLKACPFHDDMALDVWEDRTAAYKLGNWLYSRGELGADFESRTQLAEAIDTAMDECPSDCWLCDKFLRD